MTLAAVQAFVAIILASVATWTGLLVSVAFLLPRQTAKAEQVMIASPWKCFFQGLGLGMVLLIGIACIGAPAPPVKLIGLGILMLVGALMTVGSAGLAQTIGKRGEPDNAAPNFGMLMRGSLVYSLAMGFPVVGWFVFTPLALVFALGAGLIALRPERQTFLTPPNVPPNPPDYDIANRQGAV
jgi:hypothetical protein